MKNLKISTRLMLLILVSVLVMAVLVVVNWVGLNRLSELKNESQRRTHEAGQLKHVAGLRAQAYRIVADTFINRQFDDAATKWRAMSGEIDAALDFSAKVADTAQERQWAQDARKAMPTAAWINPPPEQGTTTETAQPCTVNL